MTEQHDTMMYPTIEELLSRTDSKFRLVTLGALRACQINSYFGQLGDGLGAMVPPQVLTMSRKPLSIAFEEVASDKIIAVDPAEATEEETPAEALIPTGDTDLGGDDLDGAQQDEVDLDSAS
ncbi:DNA-directed RNA polymerase subunit omega [Candidatus Poriferisocius sp.]|uniref:DNA-directed RNA polymerase subunit omega n=1 Tax=Candidatus Poriferisocius sp. TaxID=3101276 RepID=UPI003B01FF7D